MKSADEDAILATDSRSPIASIEEVAVSTIGEASKTYLGVGLYSFPEAARIIGVAPRTLRRWAREYLYQSRGNEYFHASVIARHFGPDEPLTFLELIEFLFVKLFRSEGVSLAVIRRASERATMLFHTPYPFTIRRFDTDGNRIFATLEHESSHDRVMIEELSKGQLAFDRVVRPFFRKLDYYDDENVLRYWPMEHSGRVVLDPQRAFGKPIDADTGVPTEVLFDALIAGEGQSAAAVAEWFEVPEEAVIAAERYERSLHDGSSDSIT
jgi:uncharacterized protein (DUF433 family)